MSLKKRHPPPRCSLGGTAVNHMDIQQPAVHRSDLTWDLKLESILFTDSHSPEDYSESWVGVRMNWRENDRKVNNRTALSERSQGQTRTVHQARFVSVWARAGRMLGTCNNVKINPAP